MMSFNSSVLKEQNGNQNSESYMLERCIKEEPESFIPALLEFNETMHEIDVKEKINYYKTLVEANNGTSDRVLNEGLSAAGAAAIAAGLAAIGALILKLLSFLNKGPAAVAEAKLDKAIDNAKKTIKQNPEVAKKKRPGKIKKYRLLYNDIGSSFPESYKDLVSQLNNILKKNSTPENWKESLDKSIANAYNIISKEFKAMGVTDNIDASSFNSIS